MGNRLYVGNLSFDTMEDDLIKAFEQDGRQVSNARIMTDRDTGRSRGFAFVEMGNDADAQAAIQALDGTNLVGITRDAVMTIAGELDIPVREQSIAREMLNTSDEVFFTGTASEVTPIRSIDRIPVGPGTVGPITKAIQSRFLQIVRGELEMTLEQSDEQSEEFGFEAGDQS